MIFDFILEGLVGIFGHGVLILILLVMCFIILAISRGAGVTSLIGVFFLSIYLLKDVQISGVYFVPPSFVVTIVILIGLLSGFIFYMVFIKG